MKKIVILLIVGLCSWWYFGRRCEGCAGIKDKFFFIVSLQNAGIEKVAVALKQEYSHFRVILWEEELNRNIQEIVEKYPDKFQIFKSADRRVIRLYRLIHSLPPDDVVVMMNPALQDPQALSDLNKKNLKGGTSFYAGLFQQIKLEDILTAKEFHQLSLPTQLKEKPKNPKADLVVFSYDRPLQLYAFLESLEKFVKNVGEVTIICRTSHPEYRKEYEVVKKRFPHVKYLVQGKKPKKDFKSFVLKATFTTPNRYVLFAVDDIIIRDFIDVEECVGYLEKAGALGFYLRLGTNTDYCNGPQLNGKPEFQGIPPSFQVNDNVFAWQFQDGKDDWRYPHTVDMTLYRKEDIRKDLETLDYKNPNTFECFWAQKARLNQVGLYYKTSKIVNLPINLVNTTENRYAGVYTAARLLEKFKAGFKMDIEPLQGYRNCSAHTDFDITFIKRQDE